MTSTRVKTVQEGQVDAPFDVILLSCKAYDLEAAMTTIASGVGKQTAILPLLNGVRHIDVLKERFGADKVLGGLAMISAVLMPDGSVEQSPIRLPINSALGELDGRHSSRCEAIKDAFAAGGIAADVREDIIAAMWKKFFGFSCNAVIATYEVEGRRYRSIPSWSFLCFCSSRRGHTDCHCGRISTAG